MNKHVVADLEVDVKQFREIAGNLSSYFQALQADCSRTKCIADVIFMHLCDSIVSQISSRVKIVQFSSHENLHEIKH